MTVSRWTKGIELAEVFGPNYADGGGYVAWNFTRATYAMTPDVGVEFATVEEAEKALEADGWTRE